MDEQIKYIRELTKFTEYVFRELQSKIYSNKGSTHKDLISRMPDSHENFYQMLVSLKHAGRNIQRIAKKEEELYKATKNKKEDSELVQALHEEVNEQTKYFIINTHSTIEQLHKYLAAQFQINDNNRAIIQSALLNNDKTKDIGGLLRQAFYKEEGYRAINNLRNTLIHDNPGYEVLRYIVEEYPGFNPGFQTFALRLHDGEYKGRTPTTRVDYEQKLEALPINNHQIPGNCVILCREYTINLSDTPITEHEDNTNRKNTHSLNNIIEAQIQGIIPTFLLVPTIAGIYDYVNGTVGTIVSESLK